jgi:hypothetical protein
MWRDLHGQGLLARQSDPYTYRVKNMASSKGRAYVQQHFATYDQMQLAALKPVPFNGKITANSTHLILTWEDTPPSVRLLRLKPRQAVPP